MGVLGRGREVGEDRGGDVCDEPGERSALKQGRADVWPLSLFQGQGYLLSQLQLLARITNIKKPEERSEELEL